MTEPTEHLDMEMISELKEVMEEGYEELVNTYLQDSNERLTLIKSAIDAGNAEDLRSTAHSFKGSSSNIGAVSLAELLKRMEDMAREAQLDGAPDLYPAIKSEYESVCHILASTIH